MRVHEFLSASLLAASAVVGLPAVDYVLHEARHGSRHLWKRTTRVDSGSIIPLRIGLVQSNAHASTVYDALMEVAHPESSKYGHYLTPDEVIELFAPKPETADAVVGWLLSEGVNKSDIYHYQSRDWLAINLPAREVERLFMTEYHEHERDGVTRLGCDEYFVPRHLAEHIDYITPGVKLSAALRKKSVSPRALLSSSLNGNDEVIDTSLSGFQTLQEGIDSTLPGSLRDCAVNYTVECYRAQYHIPSNPVSLPNNSLGLFEYADVYAQEDLDLYFSTFTPFIKNGTAPELVLIDGATAPTTPDSPFNQGESLIDIDIALPIIFPQTVTVYQVDDEIQANAGVAGGVAGFTNTFLDAIDGSYCNSTAFGITGDSPGIDAQYPNPADGGFKGERMCGLFTPTKVISVSYAQSEAELPLNYTRRNCMEWAKLGLQGVTVLVSTGNFGVGGFPGDPTPSGCLSGGSAANDTIFNPNYPAICPFVTAVGATQLLPGQTINDPESALQTPRASSPFFSSSGGFSNYFGAPEYQKAAVEGYFAAHDPGHPTYVANDQATNIGEGGGILNRAGRGVPDVSAHGSSFQYFRGLVPRVSFGTSHAAPLWGAIITLINQERQAVGKGPVGFINPVLYVNAATVLTDIKNGSNANCGSTGFAAKEGWDPVTGLGTPLYPQLRDLFLSLP
jgi:tripeptidyl-peptidase I